MANLVKHEYFLFSLNSFLTFQSRLLLSIDKDSGVIDYRFLASVYYISRRKAKALKSELTYRNAIRRKSEHTAPIFRAPFMEHRSCFTTCAIPSCDRRQRGRDSINCRTSG
jgi:hypothetical protein